MNSQVLRTTRAAEVCVSADGCATQKDKGLNVLLAEFFAETILWQGDENRNWKGFREEIYQPGKVLVILLVALNN